MVVQLPDRFHWEAAGNAYANMKEMVQTTNSSSFDPNKDPATQFARATGGHEFVFLRQKGLEDAVQRIGTELHSHYMISYKPSNGSEGGYHTIEVTVNRSDLICKTRPGYYIGGGQN